MPTLPHNYFQNLCHLKRIRMSEKNICEYVAQNEGFLNNISTKDICDFVAQKLGFLDTISTKSSWNRFKKEDGSKAVFKATSSLDKNGDYNFYKGELGTEEEKDLIYVIIKNQGKLYYKIIKNDEFSKTGKPVYKIKETDLEFFNWEELEINENILEQIAKKNIIYNRLTQRSNNVNKEAIKGLVNQNPKKCYYCGIDISSIKLLNEEAKSNKMLSWNHELGLTKRTKRMTLEVDQLAPNDGYVEENIVWACSWCNNAKTDTFTKDEFKYIAKGINRAWNARLVEIGSNVRIEFN